MTWPREDDERALARCVYRDRRDVDLERMTLGGRDYLDLLPEIPEAVGLDDESAGEPDLMIEDLMVLQRLQIEWGEVLLAAERPAVKIRKMFDCLPYQPVILGGVADRGQNTVDGRRDVTGRAAKVDDVAHGTIPPFAEAGVLARAASSARSALALIALSWLY